MSQYAPAGDTAGEEPVRRSDGHSPRLVRRLPWLVLAGSLLLTALIWYQSALMVEETSRDRFARRVEDLHSQLGDQLRIYQQVARAGAAMLSAVPDIRRQDWIRFVDGLGVQERYPGIMAVAYARQIGALGAARLVEEARRDGVPNFRIWPENAGADRVINFFVAPHDEANHRALGFDMMSEATRRSAVERARDTGAPSATRAVTLKIDEASGAQPALIVFQAVYAGLSAPRTLAERRATFTGVVLTPLRIAPLINRIFDANVADISAEIFDGPVGEAEYPLYRSLRPVAGFTPLRMTREIAVADRIWTVRYESRPGFNPDVQVWMPTIAATVGLVLSGLLFAMVWALTSTRSRALVLAERITASLRRQEAERHQLFNQAPLGIALVGSDGLIQDCNPAFSMAAGLAQDDLIGVDLRMRAGDSGLVAALEDAVAGRSGRLEVEQLLLSVGRRGYFSLHLQPVMSEGELLFVLVFVEDIGDKRRAEQHIQYLAHFDALTGLPNRVLLFDRIAQALKHARRDGSKVGVLFIDLDRFKVINDSLGHSFGDEVLRSVARRLQSGLRESDTVGRLGGDEFLIVVPNVAAPSDAAAVADKVVAHLASPFAVGGQSFVVSPSIGISMFPDDAEDPEGLIRCADIAMYHAKDGGRNAYRFVTQEMGAKSRERLDLEANLRHAIRSGELFLVYQPQVRIADNTIVGIEALIRWRHPAEGLIMPGRFLPVAEETGLIIALGDWVLHEVCAQIRRWKGSIGLSVPVAVNVSGAQFRDGQLPVKVARALDANGLKGPELEVEVTESTLIDDIPSAAVTLQALKERGVLIALDDFGTGYSSLSYLHRFPIDKLKIDRSFIQDLSDGTSDSTVPRAVVGLGHNLGLAVIAEGVENEAQLELLRELQCGSYQGYLFSRPVTAEELEPLLAKTPMAVA